MRPSRSLIRLTLALAVSTAPARAEDAPASDTDTWHRLVGILQYLEADYPLAVETGSQFEIDEQNAFIAEAVNAAKDLGPRAARFVPQLESIQARIAKMEDPEGVSREVGTLIEQMVLAGGLSRSPRHVPDLERGKALYAQVCATCHAADGSAKVAIAETMEPKPANFLDPELMGGLTPYRAFNTISYGVKGTMMVGYAPMVNEADRWALAFFVMSMRHPDCQGATPQISLEELATSTDAQLARTYGADAVPCLRRKPPEPDDETSLLTARSRIEDAMRLFAEGDSKGAKEAVLDAYLNGVEPVEPLLAARNPALVAKIEAAVLDLRVALDNGSPHVKDQGRALLSLIDEARRGGGQSSTWAVFGMALVILLREGFEALVVIAALLAVLKRMQATRHARVVHAGWISALAVGAGAFLFAQKLLAGANREWVEGLVALVAVGMLLYAALWLSARANMSAFMKDLRAQMEGALGRGSTFGLFVISFSAVGRETFETALFLQGLSIDSPQGALWGALAGCVVLTGLVVLVSRVGYRMPMKTLFNASTVLLFATAVVLLGKGLHAIQEVGALPIRPIPMVTVDVLGIYPDALSFGAQVVLALSPFAWKLIRRVRSGRGGAAALSVDP